MYGDEQAIGCAPPMTSMVMRVIQPETERYQIMVQVRDRSDSYTFGIRNCFLFSASA